MTSTGRPGSVEASGNPRGRSRVRLALQSAVLLLAVTACCMFAGLIADRYPAHVDVTGTREHELSARTLGVLSRLDGDYELIVTMNSAAAEPRAAQRTRDVLDAFERAAPRLKATVIDVAGETGLAELDGALNRLVDRSARELTEAQGSLDGVAGAFPELSASMERLSSSLEGAEKTVTGTGGNSDALRKFLVDAPALFRLQAQDLAGSVERSRAAIRQPIGRTPVPSLDTAVGVMQTPLNRLFGQLSDFQQSAEAAVKAGDEVIPEATKQRLRPAIGEVPRIKDRVAKLLATLERQSKPPIVTVARVLERASAAVVVGPPRSAEPGKKAPRTIAAVDIETLFPPLAPGGRETGTISIDLRARTEDLLGSALASLNDATSPIVVLTHAEAVRFSPGYERFVELAARLQMRGIGLAEWAVAFDDGPPDLSGTNPGGVRPVVYVVLYTPGPSVEAAARLAKMSRAVEGLYASGKPILFSATPSTLPAIGQPDLMVDFFASCGVSIDTGRPLLRQVGTPANPAVAADVLPAGEGGGEGAHAIDSAIRGLRVRLPWALPIRLDGSKANGATLTPLLSVTTDGRTWAESQWTDYAAVPAAKRNMIRPQDLPKADSSRDDSQGPWTVAAAVERAQSGGASQRLVFVGSNTWFRDDVAEAAELVGNRVRLINPGNSELFEAAVYWLAHKDGSIGASPESHEVSIIPNDLSPGLLSAIRWMLIAGLPVLILLTGAAWRIVRG
ncbi:MAG: hypothetical protein IT438_00610 [Phycisphaerales bacterium]|nr:hypothetical protein [Phycisphaerales bacterium]